jgi:sigma-B regulation protein RsbU (phosphoserine phosphatase)
MYRVSFKGESHFDFDAPILVRDKNIGSAHIGSVHIGLREENVLKEIQSARLKILYLTLAAVILGSVASYFLASVFVKPIKGLVKDAEILGAGDLEHQIQVGTKDEVGTLAITLDTTRVKLRDAQKRLVASERLARELEIAKEIQMALLPKETPSLDRIEIGTLYRAAAQVGGDLYDFFWVSEDELGIVVADVSGKGVPGSLVMTMAKTVIRAKATKSDAPDHNLPVGVGGDPASVIRKANQMIHHDIKKGMFITANYGVLNVKTHQFQFVSAGHNDTLIYNSRTQELHEYNPKGIALGLDKGVLFDKMLQSDELKLAPGDLLLQYTDGISEAMNEQREEFGDERLKDAIRKYAHQNVNDFLLSLDQEIRSFTEGFTQSDDITAVVIKVK